jgi:hypothetical protein
MWIKGRESLPPTVPVQWDNGSDTVFADAEEDKVVVQNLTTQDSTTWVSYQTNSYGGHYWDEFLTRAKLNMGWKMWLCGLPGKQTLDKICTASWLYICTCSVLMSSLPFTC